MAPKSLKIVVLLQILLLISMATSEEQHPFATSASLARRGLDVKCTCTTCQNPCGDYASPPPPIYGYPPPPVIYSSPPPPVELPPPAIVYYSPPPPYTPTPTTPYCPPPPPAQPACCGGSSGSGGGGYTPYLPWITPPGELYPEDLGYHPGAASRGRVTWWLSLVVAGLLVLWW